MLRVWNLSLLLATFALTIFGTFLTRSGVIESVHEISASSLGPLLLGYFATIMVVSVALVGWRGDQLRSPGSIDSPISREGAFLANNLLFTLFAFVILLGTIFPLIVEAINNEQLAVGRPYFDRMLLPLGVALLLVMGLAPLLTWRSTDGQLLGTRALGPAALARRCEMLFVWVLADASRAGRHARRWLVLEVRDGNRIARPVPGRAPAWRRHQLMASAGDRIE